jgi:hypothetical protein
MSDIPLSSNLQVCEGELKLICEHGQPHGIRDRGGYLMFFPTVSKYAGQEERYRNELAERFRLADFLLKSLQSTHETAVPQPIPVTEVVVALEREAETETSPQWLAAQHLRRMKGWDRRTLMCRLDQRPSVVQSPVKSSDEHCTCAKPEPALMDHGMSSLCEKCCRLIGSPT